MKTESGTQVGLPRAGSGWLALRCVLGATLTWMTSAQETNTQSLAELKSLDFEQLFDVKVATVYGASKHEQLVTEAPSSVTIITRDEIQKFGYRTLAESLNGVSGLYVRNDRNFSMLGIRGFAHPGDYNSSFLLLVDGHRVNDAVTANAAIDHGFLVDVDLIERVEVIRGPGASLYGDNAVLGVINVITRRGRDINGAEVSASGESLGGYTGRFSYGAKLSNQVEVAISGSYQHSDGNSRLYYRDFDDPATNNGVAEHADAERSGSIFTSISWKDFTLEGAVVEHVKNIPTASYGTVFNDPRNQTKDDQTYLDLKFEHEFENELELLARVGYDRGTTLGTYVYDRGLPELVLNEDDFQSQRLTTDLQLRRTFFERHRVTVGAQLVENIEQHQMNYDVLPASVYLDDRHHGLDYALYLQEEYRICRNVIFNGGLRYDNFHTGANSFDPRLALIYQPVEVTTLKMLYGTAFRAPSPYELYYSDGGISQVPSPNLKPQSITTYELVAEQKLGKHLSASVAGFHYDIQDLIGTSTVPAGQPNEGLIQLQNLGSVDVNGMELTLNGSWARGLQGRASYAYTDARDNMTGARLVNSPMHLGKFSFTVPLYREQLFGSLELLSMSGRRTLADQQDRGYATVNATLFSRELLRGLELSASVYNLFDVKYSDPGGPEHTQDLIQQDGRGFRVKLTYRF